MAHEISIVTVNGRTYQEAMFAGDGQELNPAWHGLGVNVLEALNSKDACETSHMNWPVHVIPAAGIWQDEIIRSEDEFCLTMRGDTKALLGQVTPRYAPVQNVDAFSFLDSLVGDGQLLYESCGALKGGKVVWLLARLPHIDEIADGDHMKRYLLFTNSHDGSGAVRCLPTSVRVVCNNTLSLALGKDGAEGIKIRHVGDIRHKVEAARKVLENMSKTFHQVMEIERALANRKISQTEFVTYVDTLYPMPVDEDGKPKSDRAVTGRNNIVAAVAANYYRDERQQLDSIRGTAWAAFNAVTQYSDHDGRIRTTQGTTESESRMNNAIFGSGAKLKRKAFAVAEEMFV